MNKQEFVDQLATRTGLTKTDARTALDTALGLIQEQVKREGKITLTGFGSFELREQKATQRVNPQTGQKMNVPAKRVPKFRPGKDFRKAVDGTQ